MKRAYSFFHLLFLFIPRKFILTCMLEFNFQCMCSFYIKRHGKKGKQVSKAKRIQQTITVNERNIILVVREKEEHTNTALSKRTSMVKEKRKKKSILGLMYIYLSSLKFFSKHIYLKRKYKLKTTEDITYVRRGRKTTKKKSWWRVLEKNTHILTHKSECLKNDVL